MKRTWPIALLALYLLTPNRQYQLDALDYAGAARSGSGLFHPHHLLYNAFGFVLLRLAGLVHPVDALAALAAANALITIAAVLLLRRVVATETGDRRLGDAVAVGYGLTHGIWYMATAVEVYPMTLLAELAALALLSGARPPSPAPVAAMAAASAVAMLFHQTAIFFVPACALLLWRRSRARAMGYAALALGLTAAVYLAVAFHEGRTSARAFSRWLLDYTYTQQFASGTWGGGLHPARMAAGVAGLLGALVLPSFLWNIRSFSSYRPGPADLLPLALVATSIGLVAGLWRRAPPPERHPFTGPLVLWIALHGAFTLWWESVNFEFWLMILPPVALCLALSLRRLDTGDPRVRRRAGAALALLLLGNLLLTFLPDTGRGRNGWLAAVESLERAGVRDGDLVLSNEPAVEYYARYFGHLRLRVASIRATGGTAPGLARFAEELRRAEARGGAYLLETEARDDCPGLSAEQVAAFYAPHLAAAQRIGSYFAYGRTWTIYKLPQAL